MWCHWFDQKSKHKIPSFQKKCLIDLDWNKFFDLTARHYINVQSINVKLVKSYISNVFYQSIFFLIVWWSMENLSSPVILWGPVATRGPQEWCVWVTKNQTGHCVGKTWWVQLTLWHWRKDQMSDIKKKKFDLKLNPQKMFAGFYMTSWK